MIFQQKINSLDILDTCIQKTKAHSDEKRQEQVLYYCTEYTVMYITFYCLHRKVRHHHFIFKAHNDNKSIQIMAGTTRQETAFTAALNNNTSIKHQTVNKA